MKKQILIYGDYVEIKGVVEDCFFVHDGLYKILDGVASEDDIQEAVGQYKEIGIELRTANENIGKTSKYCIGKNELMQEIRRIRKFHKHYEKVEGGYDIWVDMYKVFTVFFGSEKLGTAKSESEAHSIISAHKKKKSKKSKKGII